VRVLLHRCPGKPRSPLRGKRTSFLLLRLHTQISRNSDWSHEIYPTLFRRQRMPGFLRTPSFKRGLGRIDDVKAGLFAAGGRDPDGRSGRT
jgi:hypothetical protein